MTTEQKVEGGERHPKRRVAAWRIRELEADLQASREEIETQKNVIVGQQDQLVAAREKTRSCQRTLRKVLDNSERIEEETRRLREALRRISESNGVYQTDAEWASGLVQTARAALASPAPERCPPGCPKCAEEYLAAKERDEALAYPAPDAERSGTDG